MKRSQINRALVWAQTMLARHQCYLPPFAHWDMARWQAEAAATQALQQLMLGWDITDFGCGEFDRLGAVFFTLRNGSVSDPQLGAPYCEKLMVMADGQRLPKHYHRAKTEDIINRGGVLQISLWAVDPVSGEEKDGPVTVWQDGCRRSCRAGEPLYLMPGSSITLTPYLAHIFGPAPGGDLVAGEVSSVNDDQTDNYWLEPVARFTTIEEDVPPIRPLCQEYARWLG